MPTIDPDSLKRAEAALTALAHRHIEWAEADCARLAAVWAVWAADPERDGAGLATLFSLAHDMKRRSAIPLVAAIGQAVRERLAGDGGAAGAALLAGIDGAA